MTPFRGNMAGAVHNYPFITGTTAECKFGGIGAEQPLNTYALVVCAFGTASSCHGSCHAMV